MSATPTPAAAGTERVAEIRARWAHVRGPWEVSRVDRHDNSEIGETGTGLPYVVATAHGGYSRALAAGIAIAAAPADVAFLLAEVERLQRRLADAGVAP